MTGQLDNISILQKNKEISNMMFTFRLSGVYTTRNAQMSFQKEVQKLFKVSDIIKSSTL